MSSLIVFFIISLAVAVLSCFWEEAEKCTKKNQAIVDALHESFAMQTEALKATKEMINLATEEIKNQQKQ